MDSTEKKELRSLILKIIALVILIFIGVIFVFIVYKTEGVAFLFLFPTYVALLVLIGLIIWSITGEPVSEQISSFILQSGGKISKPKYYSRARALVMRNKIEDGIKLYQKILNEDNTDVIAYSELGDIYYEKLKDYSSAFNCYDKMEQHAQESSDIIFAINRKADIFLTENNYPKAMEELEKIKQKFPKTKDASRAEKRINNLKQRVISSN